MYLIKDIDSFLFANIKSKYIYRIGNITIKSFKPLSYDRITLKPVSTNKLKMYSEYIFANVDGNLLLAKTLNDLLSATIPLDIDYDYSYHFYSVFYDIADLFHLVKPTAKIHRYTRIKYKIINEILLIRNEFLPDITFVHVGYDEDIFRYIATIDTKTLKYKKNEIEQKVIV